MRLLHRLAVEIAGSEDTGVNELINDRQSVSFCRGILSANILHLANVAF